MTNFFTRDNILKILIVLVIITLPIFLAIFFGKLKLTLPGFKQATTPPTPSATTVVEEIILHCPSINDFCTRILPIQENNQVLGFGGRVPANTPVRAAFNGTVTISNTIIRSGSGRETLQTITLTNPKANATAIYYFVGTTVNLQELGLSSGDTVKVGTQLGTITRNINAYNTSLLFQLYRGDPAKVQQQTLQSSSFVLAK